MNGFAVKGWCPDAWHPMRAGDGLLLRLRPRLGCLAHAQVLDLCDVAATYGNGLIDLTSRANLQLRGLRDQDWARARDRLVACGLVDPDPVIEARRAVLVAPDWRANDDTARIAQTLMTRLIDLPDLPGKFGFAIDAGEAPILGHAPADLRIERGCAGGLILRADGRETGVALAPGTEVEALVVLAQWCVRNGGGAGRLARDCAALPDWATGSERPAPARTTIAPGRHALGTAVGLPFGQIAAHTLKAAMTSGNAAFLRLTPWRIVIFEGVAAGTIAGFLHDPADHLLRTDACPGRPACPQATVATRDLARRLAPHITGHLHVSGCAKGCARARPADVMLTGRGGKFDLAFGARADSAPVQPGLCPAQAIARFGAA